MSNAYDANSYNALVRMANFPFPDDILSYDMDTFCIIDVSTYGDSEEITNSVSLTNPATRF